MDEENRFPAEVLSAYGAAMMAGQNLELMLLKAVVCHDVIFNKKGKIKSQEEWTLALEDTKKIYDKRTMGALIYKLRQLGDLPEKFDDALGTCLRDRNFLAHSYFICRIELLNSADGQVKMIKELASYTDLVMRVYDIMTKLLKITLGKYAISEQVLDGRIDKDRAEQLIRDGYASPDSLTLLDLPHS